MPVGADRVILTAGTSEGIELALGAMADAGDEVLVPTPTYPLYTAVLAKLGAKAVYYRTDPDNGWQPDLDDFKRKIPPLTRALVVIDPNNPTGAVYPEATRRALIALAHSTGVPILADEVYGDLAFDGPSPLLGSLAPDAPILSFSSLSKAYVAPGWRAGRAARRPEARPSRPGSLRSPRRGRARGSRGRSPRRCGPGRPTCWGRRRASRGWGGAGTRGQAPRP